MHKIGIIGCGEIAEQHAAGYSAYGAKIVAVADVNKVSAEKLAQKFGGAEVFEDYKSLLKTGIVDVISICTPPSTHEEIAICALDNGIHVLCEKPLAHTVESARRIESAVKRSSAKFAIGFRHRFLPAIRRIREIIGSGKLGKVVFFDNNFSGSAPHLRDRWFSKKAIAGGGTLMDTSSHSIDIFRYLFGEISLVQGVISQNWIGTDVEDASVLIVKSTDGVIGTLTASWSAGIWVAKIDVIGEAGRVMFDYHRGSEILFKDINDADFTVLPIEESVGFPEEIAEFLRSIESTSSESPTIEDGLRSLEIIQSVYKTNAL